MLVNADTIAAIATAQGRGGVGVVRISGREAAAIALAVLGKLPSPRYAHYGNFLEENGDILDQGVALFFPAPHSYTGENVLELQGHGGVASLQMLLQRCLTLGARLAEPGEFTRRAFLNNKIDLAQAESVADLIEANTTQAARSAMRSLRGDFSKIIHELVADLINLRMLVEAMLDFPEEDLDVVDAQRRDQQLQKIQTVLHKTLELAQQGSLLREGAQVAIVGEPNVGKSSLLNKLSGEEVALVSDVPGTTRDVIRQAIQIQGVPFHIMDTAGLRDSSDVVENMGMDRTHQALQRADLVMLLLDASQGMTGAAQDIITAIPAETPYLLVFNKADLLPRLPANNLSTGVYVSAKVGLGIEDLRNQLLALVGWRDQESGVFMARERHVMALRKTQNHLYQAGMLLSQSELFAEELRLAQQSLSSITGEFTADDLLGEIFSRFCIGK